MDTDPRKAVALQLGELALQLIEAQATITRMTKRIAELEACPAPSQPPAEPIPDESGFGSGADASPAV